MAIVCVKIGENEPSTYPKFAGLGKHLDIIEVIPRKRDKNGKLLEHISHTMGTEADKHYLGLNVDMSHLDDKEFGEMRLKLREQWDEDTGEKDVNGNSIYKKIARRLRTLDLSPAKRVHLGLSNDTIVQIDTRRDLKRAKQPHNMMEVNRYDVKIPLAKFIRVVRNKKTGQYLEEELNG